MDNDLKRFFVVGIAVMIVMTGLWVIFGLGDDQKILDPRYLNLIKVLAALILGIMIIIGIRKALRK